MSDGERLVMYAPMAELRRNEELPPLFLDSPDTADTAFPSSAHIDWFCWVAFDVLADPRYEMPPRSDGPPEFGAPNLTGQ
ncbi:hypothetical protein [Sinorhizobium meliloti]|uniref:hypothetical protein n=1 Tax=Rhizobium meliloti TaxID=382 RepID=UPI000B4A16D3|nr:hypothetical protein [Sinorhizobium meliloti]ASP87667.1 hypothetical protein CDO26_25420 [Sinorhizobium meliloti]ASP93645.1 hypothetical protein CDO25_21205 [Sinorhizobium meliloti]MQW29707.1 hypothetical protein [Sinorhizobium meliloti]MQX56520.1 hypothetical protein [Sinorhizobium meliloti]